MDFNKFHTTVMGITEHYFLNHNEIPLTMFAPIKEDKILVCYRTFNSNTEKSFTFDMYASLLNVFDAPMYSIAGEFYYYKTENLEETNHILPSEHKNRKEGLLITSVDRKGKVLHNMQGYNPETRQFNTDFIDHNAEKEEGLMINLFKRLNFPDKKKENGFYKDLKRGLPLLIEAEWIMIVPEQQFLNKVLYD